MLLLYYWHISSPVNWYLVMTWYTIQNLQHTRPDQRVPAPTLCQTNSTQLTFSALGISRSYFKFYCFNSFKFLPFKVFLIQEGKKAHGNMSGEYRGSHTCGMFFLATTAAQIRLSVKRTVILTLPFFWLFTVDWITLALIMKMAVHILALCSTIIVHKTFINKKRGKHHLCPRLILARCLGLWWLSQLWWLLLIYGVITVQPCFNTRYR